MARTQALTLHEASAALAAATYHLCATIFGAVGPPRGAAGRAIGTAADRLQHRALEHEALRQKYREEVTQ